MWELQGGSGFLRDGEGCSGEKEEAVLLCVGKGEKEGGVSFGFCFFPDGGFGAISISTGRNYGYWNCGRDYCKERK